MAQSNLSLQIKQLESWIGERLFQRLPTGTPMTEAGRHFQVVARQMIHMLEHAKNNTARRRNEWPLRFGFFAICPA
jgi:DNA-binding transcriptional LysR family regulator